MIQTLGYALSTPDLPQLQRGSVPHSGHVALSGPGRPAIRIIVAIAALSFGLGSAEDAPSILAIDADGWRELPADSWEPAQHPNDRPSRGPASVEHANAPRIEVTAPEDPARFLVTETGFPTFPVRVSITGTQKAPIDSRSLKVTAHKGILFKDITADVREHLMAMDCDPLHLCRTLDLNVDEFDLSQKGIGKYRFVVSVADSQYRRASMRLTVVIDQEARE